MMNTYTILYPISFTDHGNFTARIGDYCVHNEELSTLTIYRDSNIVATIKPMRTGAMQAMCGHRWMALNPPSSPVEEPIKVSVSVSGDVSMESANVVEFVPGKEKDSSSEVSQDEESFAQKQTKKSLGGLAADNIADVLDNEKLLADPTKIIESKLEFSDSEVDIEGSDFEVEEEDDQGTSVYPEAPRALTPKKKIVKKKRGRRPGQK